MSTEIPEVNSPHDDFKAINRVFSANSKPFEYLGFDNKNLYIASSATKRFEDLQEEKPRYTGISVKRNISLSGLSEIQVNDDLKLTYLNDKGKTKRRTFDFSGLKDGELHKIAQELAETAELKTISIKKENRILPQLKLSVLLLVTLGLVFIAFAFESGNASEARGRGLAAIILGLIDLLGPTTAKWIGIVLSAICLWGMISRWRNPQNITEYTR